MIVNTVSDQPKLDLQAISEAPADFKDKQASSRPARIAMVRPDM